MVWPRRLARRGLFNLFWRSLHRCSKRRLAVNDSAALGRVAWHPAWPFVIRWRHAVVCVTVLVPENFLRVFRTTGLLSVLMCPTAATPSGVGCGAGPRGVAWHSAWPFVIRWRHAVVRIAVLIAANFLRVCRA